MAALVEGEPKRQKTEDEWLVIETTYHSTYGCYRGRRWSRAERICQDMVRKIGPFATREAAIEAAVGARKYNESFCDDESGAFDGEPPWNSAALENYDNDDEVLIEVKTVAAQAAKEADDEAYLAHARAEARWEGVFNEAVWAKRVAAAGRVHYSRSPMPYDIKADLEVTELTAGAVSDAAAAAATTLHFQPSPEASKPGPFDREASARKNAAFAAALSSLCARCPQLRELHFYAGSLPGVVLTEECVEAMATAAPHLATTLVLLRVGGDLSPEALEALAFFAGLERLDITLCITCGFGGENYGSDSDDSDADDKGHPYNAGLRAIFAAAPRLAQIDLGYGDQDMTRYLWDYCVSSRCVDMIQDEYPDCLITMGKARDFPLPHGQANLEMVREALQELAESHEDAGIRALAQEALDDPEGIEMLDEEDEEDGADDY